MSNVRRDICRAVLVIGDVVVFRQNLSAGPEAAREGRPARRGGAQGRGQEVGSGEMVDRDGHEPARQRPGLMTKLHEPGTDKAYAQDRT